MTDDPRPTLTESSIRDLSRQQSYERGQSYYEDGAVLEVTRRGDALRARVEGSRYEPYRVTVRFDEAGVAATDCSCPYDHGGICKHRVAVLLTYLRDPDAVESRPPVSELVAEADRETLAELVVDLVEGRPELLERVERQLGADREDPGEEGSPSVSVNLDSVRSHANYALPDPGGYGRGQGGGHAEAERTAEQLGELVEQARAAVEAGDGETALEVLEVILDEIAGGEWFQLLPHDVPPVYEVFGSVDRALAEALLTADLSPSEREAWGDRIAEWDESLGQYTGDSPFAVAIEVARLGWDDEGIREAMAGEVEAGDLQVGADSWYGATPVGAYLAVLEREGRVEEYLNLAEAAGHHGAHAEMLAAQGRVEEAVEYGTERLSSSSAFLDLAETLRDRDHPEAATTVAEGGLAVEGRQQAELAEWLRDVASGLGEDDLALEAAVTAFEADPSLDAYRAVEAVAGDDWPSVREELLDRLRATEPGYRTIEQVVEVFLDEGLYDEAIDLADATDRASVVEPVVEAVLEERPEWVIETCKAQARPIIEQGQHDQYRTAVRWLERAGEAARASGQLDEWRTHVEDVTERHSRKYKLVPMLEEMLGKFPES